MPSNPWVYMNTLQNENIYKVKNPIPIDAKLWIKRCGSNKMECYIKMLHLTSYKLLLT